LAGMAGAGAPASPGDLPSKPPAVIERAASATEPAEADGQELAELYRLLGAPSGEALALPFLEGGDVLGALLVAMPANVQLQVDAELAAAVADLAAAAISNQRKLALTVAEARRDQLTGLPNRRAFEEHLDNLLEQSHDVGTP